MPSPIRFFHGPHPLISVGPASVAAAITVIAGCGSPNHMVSAADGGSGKVIAGTLGDYYATYASFKSTDSFTYSGSSEDLWVPDPVEHGQHPGEFEVTYPGNDLFFALNQGPFSTANSTSAVLLTLPKSGTISVSRETELSQDGTTIDGYRYFTMTNSLVTEYGTDYMQNNQVVRSSRYDPGVQIPLTLTSGSSFSQTYTDYETPDSQDGAFAVVPYSYVVNQTLRLNIFPSLTVQAGTFSDVAQLTATESYTLPANAASNPIAWPTTNTITVNLSKYVGLLSSAQVTVSKETEIDPTTLATVPVVETYSSGFDLASATINGTICPPGRH